MYEELVKRLRSQCQGYGKECEDCNADGNCRSQMENEAADAIVVLSKMEKTTQWIPVTERLPYESVFVHGKGGELVVAQYSHKHKWWEDDEGYYCDTNYVTHWMPLPEPPKEE